jgi:Peptide methionine sulfoxide reductase
MAIWAQGEIPAGLEMAMFGMGCFWGAARYAGGFTPNPTSEEVCSGRTGHNEVVMVWFDLAKALHEALLRHQAVALHRVQRSFSTMGPRGGIRASIWRISSSSSLSPRS